MVVSVRFVAVRVLTVMRSVDDLVLARCRALVIVIVLCSLYVFVLNSPHLHPGFILPRFSLGHLVDVGVS